ncbi:MAG: Dethiobiotin synthetase [Leptolyngbyaceae cyanobacterium SM1_1_3]|nr:Dethiobiotin synthetase [Leptolyngbyaceae cyanobacterium SM1_1_3]NJN03020.1 Dethiobiotin synthetase [Leptolyngbyaceae cyanobacterium RM1_1_2]NJO08373.1 Dethiobiotin synthetase [Leptolyngbyaceae cyanobacterium SL_1_1]
MDFTTARQFVVKQALPATEQSNTFLQQLQQHQAPIPGQVTSLLLALKALFEGLRSARQLDRELVYALFLLAHESRRAFDAGKQAGIEWPPLLDEDLSRITSAVTSIFADQWQS